MSGEVKASGAGAVLRVLVADDQQVVREGLVALLELAEGIDVVGAVGDGAEAVRACAETEPDVCLMDLAMPVLDGVEATRQVVAACPETAVVVLTTYADDESIAGALRVGARGYLTKDAGRVEIAAALRSAAAGQATFDPNVSRRLAAAFTSAANASSSGDQSPKDGGSEDGGSEDGGSGDGDARRTAYPDGLTAREAEILALIAGGLTNGEIAGALFIGESTVKTHINNAFAKIGARGRADAVRYAYDHGLTTPD